MNKSELKLTVLGKRIAFMQKEKLDRKTKMRNALPELTREEIIKFRLPPHEGLLRSIKLDGFYNTAEYIKQLIDYQEYVRNIYGPDTNIWIKPRLINNINILNHLREGLSRAEKAHMSENIGGEINEILKLAVEYAFGEENWWWLGHQLIDQAINISKNFTRDGGMCHAFARYVLGKFLLEQITDIEAALEHLNIARSMSAGTSWNARLIFKKYQKSVFSEVSILLYKVMLTQARRCMRTDTILAIQLCKMAKKAALDGCHYAGQTEAYILQGECEQWLHDTDSAICSFQKALAIQTHHEEPKWKCEALSHLGVAYLKHGYYLLALKMLHQLKDYAYKNFLIFYVAQAYKYLGEYYLKEGTSQNATPLLKIALKLFNDGPYINEAESTRNYAAISVGIELINFYIHLIIECDIDNPNYEANLKKLIDWKDSRVTFWNDVKGEVSFGNLDDIKSEDEKNLLIQTEKEIEKNKSREVVLSVLSLVDSKESLELHEKSPKTSTVLPDKSISKESSREVPKEEISSLKKASFEGEPGEKEIITLHVAEHFEKNDDDM